MRNYTEEYKNRIEFIRSRLETAHADGIVFGNSGGKDSALVGILCKAACPNTVGIIMPCASKRNYGIDADDGKELAEKFNIETRIVDLTPVREAELAALEGVTEVNQAALTNIAPRLRMTTLYTIGAAENRLVAGTGNRSEIYMGYFTKWGDGASDFNPIADLTASEVFEFLASWAVRTASSTKRPPPDCSKDRPMRMTWASPTPLSTISSKREKRRRSRKPSWTATTPEANTSASPSRHTRTGRNKNTTKGPGIPGPFSYSLFLFLFFLRQQLRQ